MGYLFCEKDKIPCSKGNSRVNNFEKQICEFIIFLDVYSLAALTYNHMHLQGEHLSSILSSRSAVWPGSLMLFTCPVDSEVNLASLIVPVFLSTVSPPNILQVSILPNRLNIWSKPWSPSKRLNAEHCHLL